MPTPVAPPPMMAMSQASGLERRDWTEESRFMEGEFILVWGKGCSWRWVARELKTAAGAGLMRDAGRMISIIVTTRLKLIPATVAHVRAEMENRAEFARLIGAEVPENWPPESVANAMPLFLKSLEATPDEVGWFGWYAVVREGGTNGPCLVGSGGFLGPPKEGVISIDYSVLAQFQGRSFATEMVGGLVKWALGQPGVARIAAQTEWENPASVRVLTKAGFSEAGVSANGGGARFEMLRRV